MCEMGKKAGKEHCCLLDCCFNSNKQKAEYEQCDCSNVILDKGGL